MAFLWRPFLLVRFLLGVQKKMNKEQGESYRIGGEDGLDDVDNDHLAHLNSSSHY